MRLPQMTTRRWMVLVGSGIMGRSGVGTSVELQSYATQRSLSMPSFRVRISTVLPTFGVAAALLGFYRFKARGTGFEVVPFEVLVILLAII
jgi:hypothetical protein